MKARTTCLALASLFSAFSCAGWKAEELSFSGIDWTQAHSGEPGGLWVGNVSNYIFGKLQGSAGGFTALSGPTTAVVVTGNQIKLLPAPGLASSDAIAISGANVVGNGTAEVNGMKILHPLLWSLNTGTTVDLLPSGFEAATLTGVAGPYQVGAAMNGEICRAMLWQGGANFARDLTPSGCEYSELTGIFQLDSTHFALAGSAGPSARNVHPLYWPGIEAQPVDLMPQGASASGVLGLDADTQVGVCDFAPCLWHGTAESFVNLLPPGAATGEALAAAGRYQVGNITIKNPTGCGIQAALWGGSARSFVNLSQFLKGHGISESIARSIKIQDGRIVVYGEVQRKMPVHGHPDMLVVHAVRWTYTPESRGSQN